MSEIKNMYKGHQLQYGNSGQGSEIRTFVKNDEVFV